MAIVAEGNRGRSYLAPNEHHETVAESAVPVNVPESDLPEKALSFRVQAYGMVHHRDLFTQRQLTAICTFSTLINEVRLQAVFDGASQPEPPASRLTWRLLSTEAWTDPRRYVLGIQAPRWRLYATPLLDKQYQ